MLKNLPKEKREKLILSAIVTIAVTAGLWCGVVSTMSTSLQNIDKRMVDQKNKVEGAQRLVNSVGDLQKSLEEGSAKLRTVEQEMASGDMYSWVILTINKFRADRKVDIPQFSREVRTDIGLFPKFPYKAAVFTIRGTAFFHDIGKFISDFENAFPYTYVQNLELEPANTSNATVASHPETLAFKMEIVTLINPNTL